MAEQFSGLNRIDQHRRHRPQGVLTPGGQLQRSRAIAQAYAAAGVPLIVNYTRRFVPAYQAVAGMTAMTATIRYAKGMRHNGTHAIDLCRMLFGECLEALPLARKTDFWPDDPTVSAFLRFARGRGNDLITPAPEHGFPGLKPGDRWCVCAPRWLQVQRAGAACRYPRPLTADRTG